MIEKSWTCCANDAVTVRLLEPELADPSAEKFHPTFTHQVFRADETIRGYAGLSIELRYNAATLAAWPRVAYSGRCEPADDLDGALARLLGRGRVCSAEQFRAPAPLAGEVVHTYTRHRSSEPVVFEVRRATFADAAARELNSRITSLLLLFVDGASRIDETDHKWVTFACYERRAQGAPHVVGYTTVYPFSVVLPGGVGLVERFRLSQILVLPPYLRGGHGAQLLNCVYREAAARGSYEVAIEDPGPDMMRCQLSTNIHNAASTGLLANAAFHWQGKETFVAAARESLLLAAPAATAVFEFCMLALLDQTDEEALRTFRLALKARLFKEDEQLQELEVDARKEELALRYEECYERYSTVLTTPRVRAVLSSALLVHRTDDPASTTTATSFMSGTVSSTSSDISGGKRARSSPERVGGGCDGWRHKETEKMNSSDSPEGQLNTQRLRRTLPPHGHGNQGSRASRPAWCIQHSDPGAFAAHGGTEVQAKE